jgi:hypothetical protein
MVSRTIVVSLICLLSVMALGPAALAMSNATAEGSLDVSTASWLVSPAPRNGQPVNEPLPVSWTVVTNTAYSYFDAVNTGAGSLSTVTLTALSQAVTTRPGMAPTVTFVWCQGGTWDTDTNECSSGTVIPLGSFTGQTTFTTVVTHNLGVGERLALRATTPQNRRADLTTTVSFSASRASAPPPVTTSS